MQRVGQLDDPLLVGPADDQRARAVVEQLLEGDDLAGRARCPRASTTLSDSLSTTSGPASQVLGVELGVQRDPHLAAAGEHVDGAVVVACRGTCRRPTAAG